MENIKLQAVDTLLDEGIYFEVERTGLFRIFGKKRFIIKPSKLGTLFMISKITVMSELNANDFEQNPIGRAHETIVKASKGYAKVLAIAVLNSRWKIMLFSSILGNYFFWKVSTGKLLQLMQAVVNANNILAFMSTIRLMSGIAATLEPSTKTSPVEQGG